MNSYEVKADPLEASFDAFGPVTPQLAQEVAQLRGEVQALGARIGALGRGGRPPLAGAKAMTVRSYAPFVEGYLRKGLESGLETKAIGTATDAAGGYAIPREIDAMIAATLRDISPIRSVANVVAVGSSNYRKLVATGGFQSGWAADTVNSRPETTTPTFQEVAPPMGDLYANPAVSQVMLDDVSFDLEGFLAEEIAREFAKAEGTAFVGGNGAARPKGFLTYPTVPAGDAARPFGTLQHVLSGAAGDFPAGAPQDKLIDLVHALRPAYRQGAVFVMNSSTLARVRKMKDADGAFIWRAGLAEGQPDTLLGYPVVEAEDMPDIAAGSLSIAFGNFRFGYVIAERMETRILRDPFSNKPFVNFYATRRVGGAVANSEAIKLMKFAAS